MTGKLLRSIAALALAAITAVAPVVPVYGQNQAPVPPQPQTPPQAQPVQTTPPPAVPPQPRTPFQFSSGPDYTKPQPPIWNFLLSYAPRQVDQPQFANSPHLDQLIHDGKLQLSLSDAIALALESNLDIGVQRYYSWMAETDMLRTKAGGAPRGVAVSTVPGAFANVPTLTYDPTLTAALSLDRRDIAVNNPLTAGTGANVTATVASLITNTGTANFQYAQSFHPGTTLTLTFNNTRQSTSSAAVLFDPSVTSNATLAFSQPLLNGAGRMINERYIRMALLTKKAVDFAFQQSIITDITAVEDDYWELVFARGNVDVQKQAVGEAQQLYDDNQKQVEIGTLAPIEIVRAEAQLATAQQALITAQLAQVQQQILLMSVITKDPIAGDLRNIEVVTTESVQTPPSIENIPLTDAVSEALAQRPDVASGKLVVNGDDLNVKFARNALLPTLTLSGFWTDDGLGGKTRATPTVPSVVGGFGDAAVQIFQGQFPEYEGQLALTLPIRNRIAQADSTRALLTQRQDQVKLQQIVNGVAVDVQNAQITLQEDRAALTAAQKTRELQERTLDADQRRLQLGTTNNFVVVTDLQTLSAAAAAEVRASVNLQEAEVNFERALGRTLAANKITLADAKTGTETRETLIPGTSADGEIIGGKQVYGLLPTSPQQ